MRELKFRAWDNQDKRMIVDEQEFMPLKVTNKGVLKLSPLYEDDLWQLINSNRFIIMQYTGLKDINEIEIYEGDIVRGKYHDTVLGESEVVGIVEFKDGAYLINGYYLNMGECEVLGDIYNNPKLMENSR